MNVCWLISPVFILRISPVWVVYFSWILFLLLFVPVASLCVLCLSPFQHKHTYGKHTQIERISLNLYID